MTDKQIIIDGVDVSECGFYHSETGTECHIALAFAEEYTDDNHTYFKCEQNPNCYYKQLKAKEQECEEYKKQFKADTKEMEDYQNEIVRHLESIEYWQHQAETKEQECEELKKKQRCAWKSLEGTFCPEAQEQLEAYKMEADEGKEINAELKAELEQEKNWHKTSDEISKVNSEYTAKLKQTLTEIKEIAKKRNYLDYNECLDDILQKISECEANQ